MPNLIVERGREKGVSYELKSEQACVAGRDPASVQIVITDPAASRRHFQVAARDGKWYVTDLGSRNATYLNEEKLERERELASGDRIQVGETVLSFLDEEKGDKSAAQGLNGKELGGYKILDRLGRGGMGTVFKAKQVSLNRVVALKVLASKFAKDPKFVEKFVSEARAAGQLNHPNVVQVFDVGQLGGLHYFSMELMEGGCVQDLLSAAEGGRLTWQEAMPLIVDAARGLVFAEKRGIIHRDIKPDNLMLTSEQRVKIGDLGLAKKAEEGSGDKQIFGTPHFIAPEQAQGKPDVGHPADLYALGATFYRIVTGKTPFSGETVKEILRKQINDQPQPIKQIVPDFPDDLAAIIEKLMAKKVENRYQSATKLVEDLEGFQLAHQIELSGASKKNKPLMIGLAVVTLAAIGVGIHEAMKPVEVITHTNTVTKTVVIGTTGPIKTDEDVLKSLLDDATNAVLKIQLDDAKLGPLALEKKDDFIKIAERFEALATKFPEPRDAKITDAIKPGLDRAKEIRDRLKAKEDELVKKNEEAHKWWTDLQSNLKELEAAKNWSEAIRVAVKQQSDARALKMMEIVKEAKAELAKVEAHELQIADEDFKAMMANAEDSKTKGDIKTAIQLVREWADALAKTDPPSPKLKAYIDECNRWIETQREAFQISLGASLDQEKLAYVNAVLALHEGGSGGGVMFDYQFEAAAVQLEAATKDLKTYPYKDRAAALAGRFRAAQKAWSAFIDKFGDYFKAGDEIRGLPGASADVLFTVNLKEKPTLEGFTVEKLVRPSARGTQRFKWADFTREELFSIFILPKADKLPGDVSLGFAWMFVELGHPAAANAMLEAAMKAGAQIAPADETSLRREIGTLTGYEEVRKKAGGEPNEVVKACTDWRAEYGGANTKDATDGYIAIDGRPGQNLLVISQEQADEYVKNMGERPPVEKPPK